MEVARLDRPTVHVGHRQEVSVSTEIYGKETECARARTCPRVDTPDANSWSRRRTARNGLGVARHSWLIRTSSKMQATSAQVDRAVLAVASAGAHVSPSKRATSRGAELLHERAPVRVRQVVISSAQH